MSEKELKRKIKETKKKYSINDIGGNAKLLRLESELKGRQDKEKEILDKTKKELVRWLNEPYEYLGDGEYQFIASKMRFRWTDLLKFIFNLIEEDLKEHRE